MYLAVDIGGTKTLIALFSKRGRVLRKLKFQTAQGSKTFLDELAQNLARFKRYKIKAIAVAVPGHVRFEQKNYSAKFGNRSWGWINISAPFQNLFSCPTYFENDANLASIYESKGLKGKTVFLTFSTGVGGGLAENGTLLIDDTGRFEPGHQRYFYEGEVKEWEDIAAASAIENYYHVDFATNLKKRAELEEIARRIALGLPDIVQEHHPDTIVLGGPMGKIFKLYAKYLPSDLGVKLRRPKRPTESVIYGCYLYAKQKERG
ncbi:ROK family protein [Candidatus Saccharibacteria bacterium]|nr:ROK family protein [Candidatus Saccharibacteria bacterium]